MLIEFERIEFVYDQRFDKLMNNQDTSFSLTVHEPGTQRTGLLKLQHNNGNVTLSFFQDTEPDAKKPGMRRRTAQIPDFVMQLIDFTQLEKDPENPLNVALSGPNAHLRVTFGKNNDITSFLDYIGQKVSLRYSDYKPNVFVFESRGLRSDTVSPFMTAFLPKVRRDGDSSYRRISPQRIQAINLSPDDREPEPLTPEQFNALFGQDGKAIDPDNIFNMFFNRDIDPTISGEVIKIVLDRNLVRMTKEERTEAANQALEIYKTIKNQWRSTSPAQWANHTDLQKIVKLMEDDLHKHDSLFAGFGNPKLVQKLAFNVLLTLSFWSWDRASYSSGMVEFIAPFLDAFIKDSDGTTVTMRSGAEVPVDNAESEVFWTFEKFYNTHKIYELVRPTNQPSLQTILVDVGEQLSVSYKDLLELYSQKHVSTLVFLRDDFNHWFSTCFQEKDLLRLWISAMSCSTSGRFFTGFIIALLYALAPEFVKLVTLNNEGFVKDYNRLKTGVKLNNLLINTKLILSRIPEAN